MDNTYQPFQIRSQSASRSRQILSLVITIVLTLGLAVFLNLFVFQSYFVDGESMSPTLHSGDRLVISRVERTVSSALGKPYIPTRGQIVVINGEASPTTADRAPELIKRVIGLPGDRVIVANKTVTVISPTEGAFDASQKLGLNLAETDSEPLDVVVPDNSVFVVGDNRTRGASLDSRIFGSVKSQFIDGRLLMRIMPFDGFRVF
jgi:signal peptidase I